MNKYINENDQIAVLVSSGFGAGWSTWADSDSDYYAMDKSLVEMKLRDASSDEVEEYLTKIKGKDHYHCMGGWDDVEIEWLDKNTAFTIEEYDGSESLRLISDLSMST